MIIGKFETGPVPRPVTVNPQAPLVMVVDDDDDIRTTLGEILATLKYDVTVASHGLDALTQLRVGVRPDVILLDLMMPVMDGYEFILELRRHAALATIPILVITAAGNAQVEAAKIAAAGHIQKPFKANELLAAIDQIVSAG